jgi:hypothetical protein
VAPCRRAGMSQSTYGNTYSNEPRDRRSISGTSALIVPRSRADNFRAACARADVCNTWKLELIPSALLRGLSLVEREVSGLWGRKERLYFSTMKTNHQDIV